MGYNSKSFVISGLTDTLKSFLLTQKIAKFSTNSLNLQIALENVLKTILAAVGSCYSLYTILWKPPFCKLTCSKTLTYKSDIAILLYSKSRKKCHKNFENQFINKNLTPKNDFDMVFYTCKGGNLKFLNLKF